MENILVIPTSEKEKNLLKELFEKMKINFRTVNEGEIELSEEEISDIESGLEDFESGEFDSSETVRKMMAECLK